jgi:hypothetical protein
LGALIRFLIIVIGLLIEFLIILVGIFVLIVWILVPLLSISGIVFAIILIKNGFNIVCTGTEKDNYVFLCDNWDTDYKNVKNLK